MTEKKEKATEKEKTLFEKLRAIDVSKHIEKKNGLSYLSWAWAWDVFKQHCPDATYTIRDFDGFLCTGNKELGYMVHTTVTASGESHSMWLPVMDFKNKAVKSPDTFDINKTVMRCLVKNLAMFGLGLHIYAGEDLPEDSKNEKLQGRMVDDPDVQDDMKALGYDPKAVYDSAIGELNACIDLEMLESWAKKNKATGRLKGLPSEYKDDLTASYQKLKQYFADKGE